MKKKLLLILAAALTLLLFISFSQNNPPAILSHLKDPGLKAPARQFFYKVYLFGIFPVGKAVLTDAALDEYEGKKLYHLKARSEGEGFISKLYPFSATIDSYLQPESLLPLIFLQKIKTKDKEMVKEVRYDQANHIMRIKEERRNILPETYEPLSALLKLRKLDLEQFDSFDLNINTNQKNYGFTGGIKKSAVKTKGAPVEIYTFKGRIFRRDKNPYHQSKVDFIFLADEIKTPLFIKVFASGGLITARLVETK